jgi:hypothetical protein
MTATNKQKKKSSITCHIEKQLEEIIPVYFLLRNESKKEIRERNDLKCGLKWLDI